MTIGPVRALFQCRQNAFQLRTFSARSFSSHHARDIYQKRLELFRQKQATAKNADVPLLSSNTPFEVTESVQLQVETVKPMNDVESALQQLFQHDTLVIQRQYEMMNIFFGYEQYNRYSITTIPTPADGSGTVQQSQLLGYLVEETSFMKSIGRQVFGTHRPFRAILMDPYGRPLLEFNRPWTLINSKLSVTLPDSNTVSMSHPSLPAGQSTGLLTPAGSPTSSYSPATMPLAATLGERAPTLYSNARFYDKLAKRFSQGSSAAQPVLGQVHQVWHLWRRQYDLVSGGNTSGESLRQFGNIDGGFLTWDFQVQDIHGNGVALVSRNFTGFMREVFTDSGQYLVQFPATPVPVSTGSSVPSSDKDIVPLHNSQTLTLQEKVTVLGAAMLIDFDYFSRHSNGPGGPSFLPFFFPWGGGGSSGENAPPVDPTPGAPGGEPPVHPWQQNSQMDGNETDEGSSFWGQFFGESEGDDGDDSDGDDW